MEDRGIRAQSKAHQIERLINNAGQEGKLHAPALD